VNVSPGFDSKAPGGSLTTLGYAAGRNATIDVTNLIWKGASIKTFMLFAQPPAAFAEAWRTITRLIQSRGIKPIVAKTFPLADAADALRYLTEDRRFAPPSTSAKTVSACPCWCWP
jgi:NADPH2:quinone reductase